MTEEMKSSVLAFLLCAPALASPDVVRVPVGEGRPARIVGTLRIGEESLPVDGLVGPGQRVLEVEATVPAGLDEISYEVERIGLRVRFLTTIGCVGRGEEQFNRPTGIALGERGRVWIADTGNGRLQLLNHRLRYLNEVGGFAVDPTHFPSEVDGSRFDEPVDMVETIRKDLYVVDRNNNRIVQTDRDGRFCREFGRDDGLSRPAGIASNSVGDLLVADSDRDRVVVFDRAGRKLRELGSFGRGEKQMRFPSDVAVDARDQVYVADTGNGRVQIFDHFFVYRREIRGPLERPRGIHVDHRGLVWVADGAGTVHALSVDGRPILDIARECPGLGLGGPSDVRSLEDGRLLVVDPVSSRILVLLVEESPERLSGKVRRQPDR